MLRFAEMMTRDVHEIDDAFWSELTDNLGEDGALEIAATIGLFNYLNRLNDVLKLE